MLGGRAAVAPAVGLRYSETDLSLVRGVHEQCLPVHVSSRQARLPEAPTMQRMSTGLADGRRARSGSLRAGASRARHVTR
jgi:hypothetical protein